MTKSLQSQPPPATTPLRRTETAKVIQHRQGYTWWPAALVAGLVLVGFLAVAFFVLPHELPAWYQRLLALLNALLVLLVFICATHRSHHLDPKTIAQRLQQRHHTGPGAAPPPAKHHGHTVELPVIGEVGVRALSGTALFLGVLIWWLTPLAPVRVRAQELENLAVPLGNEIEVVVLELVDGELAVPHPPLRPALAGALAAAIPATAGPYRLGQKATAQGFYQDAEDLLKQALKDENAKTNEVTLALAQNALLAGKHVEAAGYYNQLLQDQPSDPRLWCQAAVAWLHVGNYRRAEELVRKSVDLAEKHKTPAERLALASCLHVQAAIAICRGNEEDKIDQWNKRIQEIWGESVSDSTAYAASLNNQAVFFTLIGKYPGAQNNFNYAASTWQKGLGSRHPYLAVSRSNLAMVHYIEGRYFDAQRMVDDVRRLRNEILTSVHSSQGLSNHLAALVDLALGRGREGLPLARQALERLEANYSSQHPQVAAVTRCLGSLYEGLSRYRRAENYYFRTAEISQRMLPNQHPYLATCFYHLGCLYLEEERWDEARNRAEAALKLDEKLQGPDHPVVARDLVLLAKIRLHDEQATEARALLERALRIQEASLPPQHPDLARTQVGLAGLEGEAGLPRYETAIATAEAALGDNHPLLGQFRFELAQCYLRQEKLAEAQEQVRRCLAIRRATLAPYHPGLAEALELQAELLRRTNPALQGEAESLEKQADKIRIEHEDINAADDEAANNS